MNQTAVAERVETFVRTQFAVAPADRGFSRSTPLFDRGYVDSMGIAELMVFLEEEFGVQIADEILFSDEFTTIDGIARTICRLRPADSPAPQPPVEAR